MTGKIIKYLVVCFTNGDFYKIGMSEDPNEATEMMKRDVLHEIENAGCDEYDKLYKGVKSGSYDGDYVNIDSTTAWLIMQIDIDVSKSTIYN